MSWPGTYDTPAGSRSLSVTLNAEVQSELLYAYMQNVTVPPEHSIEGVARLLTCTDGATTNTLAVEQYDAANGVKSVAMNVAQAVLVINAPSAVAAVAAV